MHGYSDGIQMQCFPSLTALPVHATDEGEILFILDNEGIIHTSQKVLIMSVTQMRAFGRYDDYRPTIFTRDGKEGRSRIISDRHEVKFKLQYGLYMVHVRKTTEYHLNDCTVAVLTPEMVYNNKELIDRYLDQNHIGAWDKGNCKKFVDITVRDILKSIL